MLHYNISNSWNKNNKNCSILMGKIFVLKTDVNNALEFLSDEQIAFSFPQVSSPSQRSSNSTKPGSPQRQRKTFSQVSLLVTFLLVVSMSPVSPDLFPFRPSFLLGAGALVILISLPSHYLAITHYAFVSFILPYGIVHSFTSISSTSAQLHYPETLIDITRSSIPITYFINTYYNLCSTALHCSLHALLSLKLLTNYHNLHASSFKLFYWYHL